MDKNNKIILVAFASLDLKLSAVRLINQAKLSNYYDEIKVFNTNDFDKKMSEFFLNLKNDQKKRGFGYWFWKPMFVQKVMNEIKENDIIHYVDVGCHIQNKNKRFYEYLEIIKNDNIWLLPFQYHLENIDKKDEILFQNRDEYKFTKSDLLNYFGYLENRKFTHSPQFWSGMFFIKKDHRSKLFLKNWVDVFDKRFDLIDDSESSIKNLDGFIENRHDQSIFSLLCKKYDIKSLSAYECEWGEKNNQRTWEHNLDNPVLAKRDLSYNIFKRFINRQIRNYSRYKKKLFN